MTSIFIECFAATSIPLGNTASVAAVPRWAGTSPSSATSLQIAQSMLTVCSGAVHRHFALRRLWSLPVTRFDSKGNVDNGYLFEIKSPDQPLDVANLAAIVCLPGYFRVIGFGTKVWACNANGLTASGGLGYSNQEPLGRAVYEWFPNDYCIVQSGDVLDQKNAEAWIDSVIDTIQDHKAAA
jgi:hypothetical protein